MCGKWHYISVDILHGNNEILRRCPECHAAIKLMKKGRNGQRAHFEHHARNPKCKTGSAFGWAINYEHKPIVESENDVKNSYLFRDLLDYIELNFNEENGNEDVIYLEGAKKYITHLSYERDSNLSRDKKARVLEEQGALLCEACGFDFHKKYGERGRGYIECHHNNPVSEMNGTKSVTLNDLTLLCANCHRIAHRSNSLMTLVQLKEIIT